MNIGVGVDIQANGIKGHADGGRLRRTLADAAVLAIAKASLPMLDTGRSKWGRRVTQALEGGGGGRGRDFSVSVDVDAMTCIFHITIHIHVHVGILRPAITEVVIKLLLLYVLWRACVHQLHRLPRGQVCQ